MDEHRQPNQPTSEPPRRRRPWVLLAIALVASSALIVAVALGAFGGSGTPLGASKGDEESPVSASTEATGLPPGSPERSMETSKPVVPAQVTDSAILSALESRFATEVTGVKVQQSISGDVRLDIETGLVPDRSAVSKALEIAEAAAQLELLVEAYPDATVSAFVWPKTGKEYLTRATAQLTGGDLAAPLNVYTESAFR